MLYEDDSTKGLPGLKPIRCAVGLTQEKLASQIDLAKAHLGQIELGNTDCLQATQRSLAAQLCCKVSDLHDSPTEARLAQIKAAFDTRKAAESQATADALAKGVA